MTHQISEMLTYAGTNWRTDACPLEDYFLLERDVSPFPGLCSACWRGYVGHWSIEDGRLYLDKLTDWDERRPFPLSDVFGGHGANRVFAHWYTGSMLLLDKLDAQAYEGAAEMKRPALALDFKRGHFLVEHIVDRPDMDMIDL